MTGNKGEIRVQELTRAQRTIARRVAESRATIPHLECTGDVAIADELPPALTLAGVVRASALALREVPRANGSYRDGHFELYSRVNVGVAIATENAFTIPTLFDADSKGLREVAGELDELRERAESGQLPPPDLAGATFTVFESGADRAAPVIVPPQAAALSAGRVRDAPIVHDGAIVAARLMTVTLACDHRILYGREATQLLAAIASHLAQAGP